MAKPAKVKCGTCGKKVDPLKYSQHLKTGKCKPTIICISQNDKQTFFEKK